MTDLIGIQIRSWIWNKQKKQCVYTFSFCISDLDCSCYGLFFRKSQFNFPTPKQSHYLFCVMTQPAGADMSHRCLMETERINGSQNSENHFSDFDWKPILLWEQSPHLRESSESCRIPENCFSAFLYLSSKRAVCTCFVPAVKPSHASVCTDWSLLNSILVPFWISLFENRMNEKKRNSPNL